MGNSTSYRQIFLPTNNFDLEIMYQAIYFDCYNTAVAQNWKLADCITRAGKPNLPLTIGCQFKKGEKGEIGMACQTLTHCGVRDTEVSAFMKACGFMQAAFLTLTGN
jgi:hypothetical protein